MRGKPLGRAIRAPVLKALCIQREHRVSDKIFKAILVLVIIGFTVFFFAYFLPPIIKDPDIVVILQSGFVNSYATGFSIDLIACWVVLILFVFYESKTKSIKYGWVCILLGLVPGVVVGWSVYLILRNSQLGNNSIENT